MWMYDAEQTRFAKRVVRGLPWKPEWLRGGTEETGSGPTGARGDGLSARITVRSTRGRGRKTGAAPPSPVTPFRLRLHVARPMHRG